MTAVTGVATNPLWSPCPPQNSQIGTLSRTFTPPPASLALLAPPPPLRYIGPRVLHLQTLNYILFTIADSRRERAMLVQDSTGAWQPISSSQVYRRVRAVAAALRSWGIGKGDRVAILSENRWEWAIADFACLAIGVAGLISYGGVALGHSNFLSTDGPRGAVWGGGPGILASVLYIVGLG